MASHKRLIQLDGLRGICSLIVAVYHFALYQNFNGIGLLSNFLIRQGDLFVDLFFVLSGFVISLNYENQLTNIQSLKQYLRKRFLRLYPLLVFSVMVFFLLQIILNKFLPHLLTTPQSLINLINQTVDSLLLMNSTVLLGATSGMNFPSWSISAEMISYIIFGFSALLFKKWKIIILAVFLLCCFLFLYSIDSYMEVSRYGFVRGLLCFIMGYFTFRVYRRYSEIKIHSFWPVMLSLLTLLVFYIRPNIEGSTAVFTLFTIPLVFSILIFTLALSNGLLIGLLSGKFLQWLGNISYSIYLNHAIVMIVFSKLFFKILPLPVNAITLSLLVAVYLCTVLIYSQFTYVYIETKGAKLFGRFKPLKETIEKEPEEIKAA